MNFLPEHLLEQLNFRLFIKKAMHLGSIAFFISVLLVALTSLTIRFYTRALAEHEELLSNPIFETSDALAAGRREAEENLRQQELILDTINISKLKPFNAYLIISALPEGLKIWEVSLSSPLGQGELHGITEDINSISELVERLKAIKYIESVQLSQLRRYSGDRMEFTVVFLWKGEES